MCYEGKGITLSASIQAKPPWTSSCLGYQVLIKADGRSRKDYWPKYLAARLHFFLSLLVWRVCWIMLWDKGRAFMQGVMAQVLWCMYCRWVDSVASVTASLGESSPVVPHLHADWVCLVDFVNDWAGSATATVSWRQETLSRPYGNNISEPFIWM